MSQSKKTLLFLAPLAATLLTGAFVATAVAMAAPKPDADVPQPVRAKPVLAKSVSIKIKSGQHRTIVQVKAKPKPAAPASLVGVVINEPNASDGTINIVTGKNEFATIATSEGTRIHRGYQLASLSNLHPGYTISCSGGWDRDGYQYQANNISVGASIDEVALTNRIAAACAQVGKSHKSGGFGRSLVAMVPLSGTPKAMTIGGKPVASPAAPPAEGTEPATAPAAAPTTTPVTPVDPNIIKTPAQPLPAQPGTLPQAPPAPAAPPM